ncbi:hypothetical protein [Alkalihalobacillus sp. BA299]|uniref:hypothetical protein n=1 Tax=Alkalihalobacillus sp. BA299 TaxID=2815938 RepID=UPI001ADAE283|nr:hypothetical protein [Alkalihalobacillus sp. BA299]
MSKLKATLNFNKSLEEMIREEREESKKRNEAAIERARSVRGKIYSPNKKSRVKTVG